MAENFKERFDEFFLDNFKLYVQNVNERFIISTEDFDFIYSLKIWYSEEFNKYFSPEFFDVFMKNYNRIREGNLNIIFYFDLNQKKYVYKIDLDYKKRFKYLYNKTDEIIENYGIIERSTRRQFDDIDFIYLDSLVNDFRSSDVPEINERIKNGKTISDKLDFFLSLIWNN